MPVPSYGALPLAKTFLFTRVLSLVALVAIIGITANFVSQIVSSNIEPPKEIIGTLVVTCVAALYCLLSIPFFWAGANLGLLIMLAADALQLIAFVIVAVLLGRPLSFLLCARIGDSSAAANSTTVYEFAQSLATYFGVSGATLDLNDWAGSTRSNCYQSKAVWGLCIVLCILFSCSSMLLPALWFKAKKAASQAGGKWAV